MAGEIKPVYLQMTELAVGQPLECVNRPAVSRSDGIWV